MPKADADPRHAIAGIRARVLVAVAAFGVGCDADSWVRRKMLTQSRIVLSC